MTNISKLPVVDVDYTVGTEEDWIDSFQLLDGSNATIDLSGISFHLQVRTSPDDPYALIDASTNGGSIIVGGTGNAVVANYVKQAVMHLVPPGAYVFDMLAHAEGYSRRVLYGTVTVVKGVTR